MKEIGGYFSLELNKNNSFPHKDGILLNSGRNALEYILCSLKNIKKIWLPYFTCESILEPIHKLNIQYSFYHINKRLEIESNIQLDKNEYLLYSNYFGIMDYYIPILINRYGDSLIVDNAQSFFSPPFDNIKTIYSPRKFVGLPDGGIAYIKNGISLSNYNRDKSYNRCSHLLMRYDEGASEGYTEFCYNDEQLSMQPIRKMSNLTQSILLNCDYEVVKQKRNDNFNYLHLQLHNYNQLFINIENITCPLIYPLLISNDNIRSHLIANKIYVATYWPNVMKWCKPEMMEYKLAMGIIPLPIDQRYDLNDMKQILKFIYEK